LDDIADAVGVGLCALAGQSLTRDRQPSRGLGGDSAQRRSLVKGLVRPFNVSRQEVNMSNTDIRDALANAIAYLKAHPDDARYTDSAATAVLESGLAVTVHGPQGMSIHTDMPKSVGGTDQPPSPGLPLRGAHASCLPT